MIFTYDTETYPFYKVGKATKDIVPRLVCMSFVQDHGEPFLLERERAVPKFWEILQEDDLTLVGANLAFDLAVMIRALIEEGYDAKEVFTRIFKVSKFDVQVAYRLADIGTGGMFSQGGYSLAQLTKRVCGVDRSATKKAKTLGPDVWRNRYNELEGVRAEDYPTPAYEYALDDAFYTDEIYLAATTDPTLRNQLQVKLRSQYDFELHLSSSWGLMIDQVWALQLVEYYEGQKADLRGKLIEYGLIDPDKGTKKKSALVEIVEAAWAEIGMEPERTPKGAVATKNSVFQKLEDHGIEDPRFRAWTSYQRAEKFLSTYLQPIMDAGDGPLCPRYNVLVDSGRTSSSGPNVQNFPSRIKEAELKMIRDMDLPDDLADEARIARGLVLGPDIRGCFIPRPGHVFVAADYSAIEMAGFAQVYRNIFGKLGTLAVAINGKMDLHVHIVCELQQRDYDDVLADYKGGDPEIKRWRDIGKIVNYGGLGGGSPDTLVSFARQQGIKVERHVMERAQQAWVRAFSEIDPYFQYIAGLEDHRGHFHVEQHGPNRKTNGWRKRVCKGRKGNSGFSQAANSFFQGLVADGALWAIHLIYQDMYLNEESPLFGARHLLFVHDENVLEVREEVAEAAGARLSELMVEGMNVFLPDLLVEAEPEILETRWAK